MSPIAHLCPTCRLLIPANRKTAHQAKHHRERIAHRATLEPWTRLYNTPQWKTARQKTLRRDAYSCRECGTTDKLEIHHHPNLSDIYHHANSWETFIADATNPHALTTLCASHHRKQDAQRRNSIT
jgi:5-methylcytosine-specific restriction endonuclease McrA